MPRLLILIPVFASLVFGAETREKKYKGPELEFVEVKAYRVEGRVMLDGKVRNCGVRALRGLVLLFDFMAPGAAVITSQKMPTEEPELEPGQEHAFQAQLVDPVRAVRFKVRAVEENGNDLKIAKPGPYAIE
jgi:hypothetical protein